MRGDPKRIRLAVLSFACGLHFALLQTSYFFLLEAYLSSRSQSYFIVLFFWLTGLLAGLRLRGERWFAPLLAAGVASYYLAFTLARWLPFHALLYPVCAACAVLSGLLPGHFFRLMGRRYAPIRSPLFHENNGFLVGLVIALKAAVHFGSFMLAGGPLAGAALVVLALAAGGRDPER